MALYFYETNARCVAQMLLKNSSACLFYRTIFGFLYLATKKKQSKANFNFEIGTYVCMYTIAIASVCQNTLLGANRIINSGKVYNKNN
jgi:hypothetical protein